MLGRKEWRIRTPFREVVVRLSSFGSLAPNAPSEASAADDETLLSELLFEFQNLNPEVVRPLLEVHDTLHGLGGPASRTERARAMTPQQSRSVDRELRFALGNGRLSVDLKSGVTIPTRRSGDDVVRLGPQATVDEVTTFIGVRVLDDQGNPVQGERVLIEFADGSVRNLRTGADGSVLVDGLNPGGPATVTLTDRNEPGDAEAPPPADTFEAQFVDETGQGIDGVEVVFSHSTQDQSQITDGDGVAKISSLEAVSVKFADLSALESVLAARWAEVRTPNIPQGDNVHEFAFAENLDSVLLVSGARSTIVITPPTNDLVIRLVDQDGAPVPNRDFVVVLPSGEERNGTTGPDGVGRIADVTAGGDATVTFPDFDQSDFAFVEALPGQRGTSTGPVGASDGEA